jgi:hypothetical protein
MVSCLIVLALCCYAVDLRASGFGLRGSGSASTPSLHHSSAPSPPSPSAPRPPLWLDLATGFPEVADLPRLRHGVQTRQFCSYDRSGDNYDHEYFPLYMEPNGECVIFDAYGPGCLYRHHMNLWQLGLFPGDKASRKLDAVRIRYYFDDERQARIDMDVSIFFSAKNPLGIFVPPLGDDGGKDYRLLYHPMFFKKRLKVTLSEEPGGPGSSDQVPWTGAAKNHPQRRSHWYQYTYQLFAENCGIESWSGPPNLSKQIALWSNLGSEPPLSRSANQRLYEGSVGIEPRQSATLIKNSGKGAILEIQLRLQPLNRETLFGTWLKILWDGQATPSVEVPLGAFFAAHPDRLEARYASLLTAYAGDSGLYCRFPMPYWKSARVMIENRSPLRLSTLRFRILEDPSAVTNYPRESTGYFRCAYQRQFPRIEGHDFRYLDIGGAGHIVGHSATRWHTSMEENERTYFDGSRTPQIQGDGFEDDQGFGWGLKERSLATYGAPVADGGSGSLYRFFIPDLYVFQASVRHGHITYGPNSPRGHEGFYQVGNETSVTYYYAVDRPQLILTDELDVGNTASENSHRFIATGADVRTQGNWWYDGEFNDILFKTPAISDEGRAIRGNCEFTVAVDRKNKGVRFRLRTDKENNRQLAKVFIDGALVTERPWYTVDFEKTYRNIRWADTDFDVPEKYTRGKRSIRVRLEHAESENGCLDAFRLWVFSYRP